MDPPRLDDPELVRREYECADRLVRRRLEAWASFEGENPEDVALAALAAQRPACVLEIGPGPGEFAERLAAELQAEVVTVDVSTRLVELVRSRGIEAHVADVQQLPFVDASFDCAAAVLYHVPDLDRGLAEIARVLCPGGRLVAITNGRGHMRDLWSLVRDAEKPVSFVAENGERILRRHFERVERVDLAGAVVFPDRASVLGYLAAFEVLHGGCDEPERLPPFEGPFRAGTSHAVFLAETARR